MPGYLSLSLLDGYGRTTSKRVEFQDHLLLADYVLEANNFMDDLDTVTDLQIVRAAMVITDGLTLPAKDPAGSNIDVGATFSGYIVDGEGKKASWKLPGVKLTYVGTGGVIDPAQADIEALLSRFVDGDPDQGFLLSDGEEIETWITGVLDK